MRPLWKELRGDVPAADLSVATSNPVLAWSSWPGRAVVEGRLEGDSAIRLMYVRKLDAERKWPIPQRRRHNRIDGPVERVDGCLVRSAKSAGASPGGNIQGANCAGAITKSGTWSPSGSARQGVSKAINSRLITPSSRAWESARAVRIKGLVSNSAGRSRYTVTDAGTACRSASYDAGAGGVSRLRNAASTR